MINNFAEEAYSAELKLESSAAEGSWKGEKENEWLLVESNKNHRKLKRSYNRKNYEMFANNLLPISLSYFRLNIILTKFNRVNKQWAAASNKFISWNNSSIKAPLFESSIRNDYL